MPLYRPNIREMFNTLAPTYDKVNRYLSFGMHQHWNRVFIKLLGPAECLVDLCAGTGRVALQYVKQYPRASAILIDFSSEMLDIAKKIRPSPPFTYIESDITSMPLQESSAELVSMAYGLRNLSAPEQALQEIYRILKPQGTLGILELTTLRPFHPLAVVHKAYIKSIVPLVGKWRSKHNKAYHYLSESIRYFPKDSYLEKLFNSSGFDIVRKRKLCLGAVTIWILKKTKRP